jgi:hypothetical protein
VSTTHLLWFPESDVIRPLVRGPCPGVQFIPEKSIYFKMQTWDNWMRDRRDRPCPNGTGGYRQRSGDLGSLFPVFIIYIITTKYFGDVRSCDSKRSIVIRTLSWFFTCVNNSLISYLAGYLSGLYHDSVTCVNNLLITISRKWSDLSSRQRSMPKSTVYPR